MNISNKLLCNKIQRLRPELSTAVTPEILDKICNEPSIQPFLRWFCKNVNHANVLSNEETEIKNNLQKSNEWLEGSELDQALQEATENYPDLSKTAFFNDIDINDLFAEHEIMKDLCKEDNDYICTLQNGIQNLRNFGTKLDEDIEKEESAMNKEYIEVDKSYKDCSKILKEFDDNNHKFFTEAKHLLNTYADAAENKGAPLLWTQMPLELFIKKIQLYDHHLGVYIKREFENTDKEKEKTDSNCIYFAHDDNKKHTNDEKLQELMLCKTNLTNAKIEEILAKIQEDSNIAMLTYIQDIYNSGNLKVPDQHEFRTEISELTRKRDFMEENVTLLQEELTEIVQQFSELEVTKILKENADTRLEQKTIYLEKLKNLLCLARAHGHVHAELLCMLMEIQSCQVKDVSEFVADAFYYLKMEYLLSSMRRDSMQQQQNEYSALMTSSPTTYNSFNKIFTSMVSNGASSPNQFNHALDKYNELIDEVISKKKMLLEEYLKSKVHKLETLVDEVNVQYMKEIQRGPTHIFKPISYEIETCYTEAFANLEKVQADLTKIRNQMKERMKADIDFKREKNLLWQRFLVDPDTLRMIHKEVKQLANKSCFVSTETE